MILMTIIVRDEADIIGLNLAWHRSVGVDRFLIIDHASIDGTSAILARYVRAGVAVVIRRDDPVLHQQAWTDDLIRRARRRYNHAWHIANDADEFYLPPPGHTLKTYLATRLADPVLKAERTNAIFAQEDLAKKGWRRAAMYRSTLEDDPPLGLSDPALPMDWPHEYYNTPGKVAFQPATWKRLRKGAHRVVMNPQVTDQPSELQILHVPARSQAEFIRAAQWLGQSAKTYDRTDQAKLPSERYRRWHTMLADGVPESVVFGECLPDADRLARDLAAGVLQPLVIPADLRRLLNGSNRSASVAKKAKAGPFRRMFRRVRRILNVSSK